VNANLGTTNAPILMGEKDVRKRKRTNALAQDEIMQLRVSKRIREKSIGRHAYGVQNRSVKEKKGDISEESKEYRNGVPASVRSSNCGHEDQQTQLAKKKRQGKSCGRSAQKHKKGG